jgi:hypothetical protein
VFRTGGAAEQLLNVYQDVRHILVDLKYGIRDNTSGSLVFRSSKGYEASGEPLPEFIYKPKLYDLPFKQNL